MKKTIAPLFLIMGLLSCLPSSLDAQSSRKAIQLPNWKVAPQALDVLNSPYRDINLSITPNGQYLYFMSGRGGQSWSRIGTTYKGKPEFDGDIYYSKFSEGKWSPPICLPATINTRSGEDEPNISADGQTLYFQSWRSDWTYTGGPYYQAELRGGNWENPRGLGSGITQFFQSRGYTATDGMSISPNGLVFVVACGPSYDGPMDLFISRKNDRGIWSEPEKLDVSTQGDERSVFIGADSKTLYFASDGWGGSGKLDIFKTTLTGGANTGELYNIGKPFNTRGDDYGFMVDAPRNAAYFVQEGDIYFAHLGDQIDDRIKPAPVVIINGTVREKGKGPLETNLFLLHNAGDEVLAKARSNSLTGEYSMSVPRYVGEYTLRVNFNEGYPSVEKQLVIDDNTPGQLEVSIEVGPFAAPQPEPAPVSVAPIPEPTATVTPAPQPAAPQRISVTVYFDYGQFTLNDTCRQHLSDFAKKAKSAAKYALEITGHTDDSSSSGFNMDLSLRRAREVERFFSEQGLRAAVDAKGEHAPAYANDSKANRAKNRRVEVVLTVE